MKHKGGTNLMYKTCVMILVDFDVGCKYTSHLCLIITGGRTEIIGDVNYMAKRIQMKYLSLKNVLHPSVRILGFKALTDNHFIQMCFNAVSQNETQTVNISFRELI